MTAADRARTWREQRRARGVCQRCPNPAHGAYCRPCELERADTIRRAMHTLRVTREFLAWMDLLAENRCVVCKCPKSAFHPLRHRRCNVAEQIAKSA